MSKCPHCGASIKDILSNSVYYDPFCCPVCKEPLIDFEHPEGLLAYQYSDDFKNSKLYHPKYDDALTGFILCSDRNCFGIPREFMLDYFKEGKLPENSIVLEKEYGAKDKGFVDEKFLLVYEAIQKITGETDIPDELGRESTYYDLYEKIRSSDDINEIAKNIIIAEAVGPTHKKRLDNTFKNNLEHMYSNITSIIKAHKTNKHNLKKEIFRHYLKENIVNLKECINSNETIVDNWLDNRGPDIPILDFQYIILEYKDRYCIYPFRVND